MTRPTEKPWQNMQTDTARRVDVETEYDFFWITDIEGRYGLLIKFKFDLSEIEIENKVKGISILKVNGIDSGKLYFLLNNNQDWEIFLSVCTDLVLMANQSLDEMRMIPIINQRIRKWQKFLSENNLASMPEILQMGLLTELHCLLYSLIPTFGYKESILSWVGPDSDKKDFSLLNFFIEVKSFISSKGRIVKISSLHQLDHEIKPLYLLSYGLTKTDHGLSVIDMIKAVSDTILIEDYETQDFFENKLASYGYIQDVTEAPFYTYEIDQSKSYLVSDDFPKITSNKIDDRIITVQYTIDLAKCTSHEEPLPVNI